MSTLNAGESGDMDDLRALILAHCGDTFRVREILDAGKFPCRACNGVGHLRRGTCCPLCDSTGLNSHGAWETLLKMERGVRMP